MSAVPAVTIERTDLALPAADFEAAAAFAHVAPAQSSTSSSDARKTGILRPPASPRSISARTASDRSLIFSRLPHASMRFSSASERRRPMNFRASISTGRPVFRLTIVVDFVMALCLT
jgi:hypothetical protein